MLEKYCLALGLECALNFVFSVVLFDRLVAKCSAYSTNIFKNIKIVPNGGSMEFQGFPKMARLSREIIISEKLDGTNAQIFITEDGEMMAGSRTRWITPEDDNYGFARWVKENRAELYKLGFGRHYGEWWGQGIQRNYGLKEKRFSLFNVARWSDDATRPTCCHVVPELYRGEFDTNTIQTELNLLRMKGSKAAPGFMKPEGIVIFHTAGNLGFKKTIGKDEMPKSLYVSP